MSASQGPGATLWCGACRINPVNGCRHPLGTSYCPYRPIEALKRKIDMRLNNHLAEMEPDCDDSITGFNEAWDIVRAAFAETVHAE